MSNAAVINATNSSGWTVGSPITIETGGDVVLKAYGTGSGSWSVTLSFAPVVGGVTGSPTTLTIGPNAPSAKTSVTKSDATQWVGWVSQAEGTWEASGIVEGYTDDEALANDLGYFASTANLPTKALKLGAKADTPSGPVTWRGASAGGWVTRNAVMPLDIASGAKASFWLIGSSSTHLCSTAYIDPSTSSAEFNEYTDGYWYAACNRYSTGWRLRYNSGVGTYSTAQIWAKMQADFATVTGYTHIILQLAAVDLISGKSADITNALNCLKLALSTGAQIILIVPHMTDGASNYSGYEEYQSWCELMASKYPSVVSVVSHFREFDSAPVEVGQYSYDGLHLNTYGCNKASNQWADVCAKYGQVVSDEMDAFGTVVVDFNLQTGSKTGVIVSTNADGSYTVTSNAALSSVGTFAITVTANGIYRIWADYEVKVAPAADNFSTGVRATVGTAAKRFGIRNNGDNMQAPVAGRYRVLGAPFTPNTTSLTLTFFPGGIGAVCVVRRMGLIRIA